MADLNVDTEKVRECGKEIVKLTNEFNNTLNELYVRLSNMPNKTLEWTGISAQEYVQKLDNDRKIYISFKNSLSDYGNILINSAERLDNFVKKVRL